MIELENVFYHNIASIGGIESFLYYFSKKYEEYDITIIYKYADTKQLERLKKYVRCIKYKPEEKIKCKKVFFNYNLDIIDNIEAEEYYQILHGDYKKVGIPYNINKKITKYLAVSQVARDGFTNATGIPAEIIYNPICIKKPEKLLRLISATRLTEEKRI